MLVEHALPLNIKSKLVKIVSNSLLLTNILWQPALNGETGAKYYHSYSESNGEGIGKGFILNGGFKNIDKWELSYEFKHDNIRYTGILFAGDISKGVFTDRSPRKWDYSSWEGSWPGGAAYASYTSGSVGWFDVTVTKISENQLRLRSKSLNRDTTITTDRILNWDYISCGAWHHDSSSFGPCRIRNVKAIKI